MYVFYEHHRSPDKKSITLTEIRLSSTKPALSISFYNTREKAIFAVAVPVMKMPPVASRVYDDTTKLWTYLPPYGEQVLQKLQEITKALGGVTLEEIEDLAENAKANVINTKRATKKSAEEFFYNGTSTPAQSTPALTKEQLALKLCTIFEISAAEMNKLSAEDGKKLYRRAALQLHPDRNNGDGSKMSELNMLWGMWNA